MTQQLLTRYTLAAEFAVSLATVDRWVADGCPVLKPSPGVVRFNLADVVAWAQTRTPLEYEDHRDRKRLERADKLDRFEADSDSRYRPDAWPYR